MRLSQVVKIACLLGVTMLPVAVQAQFTYTTAGGTVTITGYTGSGGTVTIPTTINGMNVTAIGTNAFANNNSIYSVTIPNITASIGDYAFANCANLGTVTILNTLPGNYGVKIGGYTFYQDSSLTSVMISDSVSAIGVYAFSQSGLSSFTVAENVGPAVIFDHAFEYCTSLSSFTIPTNTVSIRTNAFFACSSLTSITIPEAVTNISIQVFDLCSHLMAIGVAPENSAFSSVGGVLFNNGQTTVVAYPEGKAGAYVIPSGVTSITAYAFDSCYSLTEITIPGTVTSVGDNAFSSCVRMTNAALLNGVTTIGNHMFDSCSLSSVTIPASVTTIGNDAFFLCNLTSVTIPGNVNTIGAQAFDGCEELASVTIPGKATSIGLAAFASCVSLKAINVDSSNPDYVGVNGVLFNKNKTALIQYPGGAVGAYSIPNTVTSIEAYAFEDSQALTGLTIPTSVTSIGTYAFEGSTVTNLIIPSVTSIGDYAFDGANHLTSVTFSAGLTSIGNSVFSSCGALTSVTIPNSVTSIGTDAFNFCNSMTNVVIGTNVTSIGNFAFTFCFGLTAVSIPKSVTSIGDGAFQACGSLMGIYFAGNAPSAGANVFEYSNPNATAYYLPETSGWGSTYAGIPAMLWGSTSTLNATSVGIFANQFGFTLTGTNGQVIVVEASTNLSSWTPIQTNTLTSGSANFIDTHWANFHRRYYRLRSP